MTDPDATMTRIGRGMELGQQGERKAARLLFDDVWHEIGGDMGDPLHRCALAHAMADVQEDVSEELAWDLRAVEAADLITDGRAAEAGVMSPVAGFYPSLHLNIAECHRKLGDVTSARDHLEKGRAAVDALPDNGYGQMIRGGLDRLAQRLHNPNDHHDAVHRRVSVTTQGGQLEPALLDAVLADPVCAEVLERFPALGVGEWWLTAGAVFQNVWNAVEGRPAGYGIRDYDVFYFDDSDLSWEAEDVVIRAARELLVDLPATIEVRNQARVHLWYEAKFGVSARPFVSATDAVDAFASTTCCVAVTRDNAGLRVYAPFGLEDVFAMHMRPNRRLAPQHVYEDKVSQYGERWSSLSHEPWRSRDEVSQ